MIALAILHAGFPVYFGWRKELKPLSLINRQMMYIHTLFIALTVFLMGVLCLAAAQELTATGLGKKVSLGLGLFWTGRLLVQFFGYSSLLWKGKSFETWAHVFSTILWVYLSGVFLWAAFGR